jgi:hypothetical protein
VLEQVTNLRLNIYQLCFTWLAFYGRRVRRNVVIYLNYNMNILIHIMLFLMISFWAYCNLFYEKRLLPYREGYLIFSVFQWILVLINFIHIYNWLIGIIISVILIVFGAIILTNYTTNQIYSLIFKNDPMLPLALFATSVTLNAIITTLSFII